MSAFSEQSGTVSGTATHYVLAGLPNCSYPSPPANDLFVALSPSEYDGAAACGGYLTVTGPDGSVTVQVIDQCPECAAGHIDLSEAAFAELAPLGAGLINVHYQHLTDPPLPGPVTMEVKSGSSQYWLALLADNTGNPLASVQVETASGGWLSLARASYNYWIAQSGAGTGPFTVRLTDIEGNQVTLHNVALDPGAVQSTGVYMYGAGSDPAPPAAAAASATPRSAAPPRHRLRHRCLGPRSSPVSPAPPSATRLRRAGAAPAPADNGGDPVRHLLTTRTGCSSPLLRPFFGSSPPRAAGVTSAAGHLVRGREVGVMPEFPLTNAYWPAQTFAPLRESTIGSILRDAAARAPDKIALIDGDPAGGERRRWTYLALLADAERAARALLRRFSPGERIAVWAGNSPEWVILEFAAALAGLTLVTVNPAYQGDELAHVLGHSEADGLFMADEYRGADLHAILADVRGRLPRLREVISFGDRDDFAMRRRQRAASPGRPVRRRAAAVHVGHDRPPEGRAADPSRR